MSLPNGFLDELRARASLTSIVGRKVTWDRRKSNPGRGDWWAPCPFHHEKSASFHVVESQGFYKCFGCGAAGDAISFLREIENMSFMEAVEALAEQAGMEMPARDPKAAERENRRKSLSDVAEIAAKWFSAQLTGARAAASREYLKGRGMTGLTAKRFGIGYAPDDRAGLQEHLAAKGVPLEDMIACGVLAKSDDGRVYPRFRDRIIFPIRDARGRCISFGGRAMQKDAKAKYLNGPETSLFDKSRNLYNLDQARAAAGKAGRLIVAEGYMDVIALVQAGFEEAVAPLGTAVTETQMQLMWRMCPEPVIALDGDAAGLRAAERVIDLALPHLGPERSLRFCLMPDGLDPDDLIRERGVAAMEEALGAAVPLIEMLWRRETGGQAFDTPERRAALDARLADIARKIPDRRLRRHYVEALAERRAALFGIPYTPGAGLGAARPAAAPDAGPTASYGDPWDGRDYGPEPPGGPQFDGPDFTPDYPPDFGGRNFDGPGFEGPDFAPPGAWDAPAPPGMADMSASFERGAPVPPAGPQRGGDSARSYGEGRAGQGRAGQGRAGQGRAGQGRGRGGRRGFGGFGMPEGPVPQTALSALARLAGAQDDLADAAGARLRETAILWGALHHPAAAIALEERLAEAPFTDPARARLRDAMIDALADLPADAGGGPDAAAFRDAVQVRLGADPVAAAGGGITAALPRALGPKAGGEEARDALEEALERHCAILSARAEMAEAARALAEGEAGEDLTHRLASAALALHGVGAGSRKIEGDDGDEEAAKRLRAFPIPSRSGRKG